MEGDLPATGSVAALISKATGVEPYFVGKPNPLMMRAALNLWTPMVHADGHAGVDRPAGRGSTGGDSARGGPEWARSRAMTRPGSARR